MTHDTTRPAAIASVALIAALGSAPLWSGCAPETDPVAVRLPARSPETAAVRLLTVPADSVAYLSYDAQADVGKSDRLLFGDFGGIRARTFVKFEIDSIAADSLAARDVTSAELRYSCIPGASTDSITVEIMTYAVMPGASWSENDTLSWPGPAIDEASVTATPILDDCDETQVSVAVSPAVVEGWLDSPADANGLMVGYTSGASMIEAASAENLLVDSELDRLVGPVLAVTFADLDETYLFSETTVSDDVFVLSPDEAVLPCADPADCLVVSRGVNRRILTWPRIDLPPGSNVHRATINLHVLGHPRFDRDLPLQVFRLTSEWPTEAPVDSMVTNSGVVWHTVEVEVDGDSVVEVPITDLVQAWHNGIYENRGVMVRTADQDEGVSAVAFASPMHPDEALRPSVTVAYTVPYGGRP